MFYSELWVQQNVAFVGPRWRKQDYTKCVCECVCVSSINAPVQCNISKILHLKHVFSEMLLHVQQQPNVRMRCYSTRSQRMKTRKIRILLGQ